MVETSRKLIGATNPRASNPGTIRGDYGIDVGRYVHSVSEERFKVTVVVHAGLNLAYSEIGTVKKQFFFWNRGQVKKKNYLPFYIYSVRS